MYNKLYEPHKNLSVEDTNKYLSLKSIFRDKNYNLHIFDFITKNNKKVTVLPDDNPFVANLGNNLIIKKYNENLFLRLYLTNFEEFLYKVDIKLPSYHSKGYEEDFENVKWNYLKTTYNLLLSHERFIDIPLNLPRDFIVGLVADCTFHYIEKELYLDITSANVKQIDFDGMLNDVSSTGFIKYPSRITITNAHTWLNSTTATEYNFKAADNKFTEFLIDSDVSPVFTIVPSGSHYSGKVVFENLVFTNLNPDKDFVLFDLNGADNVVFKDCIFYDFHYNIILTSKNSVELNNCSFINCEMYDYDDGDRQIIINDYPDNINSILTPTFYLHNFTDDTNTDTVWQLINGTELLSNDYKNMDIYNLSANVLNPGYLTIKESFNPLSYSTMGSPHNSTRNLTPDHTLLVIKDVLGGVDNVFFSEYDYCTYMYLTFWVRTVGALEYRDNDMYVIFDDFDNKNSIINYENDYYESNIKKLVSPDIDEFKGLSKTYLKFDPDELWGTFNKMTVKIPFFNDFNVNAKYYIGFKLPYGYYFNRLSFKLELQMKKTGV